MSTRASSEQTCRSKRSGGAASTAAVTRRILIVEDDRDTREALCIGLTRSGYEVRAIADGARAVALAQTFRPHVVLLDLCMPGCDGMEVLRRIELTAGERTFPVVAISALDRALHEDRVLAAGASAYLQKPFSSRDLLAAIHQATSPSAE